MKTSPAYCDVRRSCAVGHVPWVCGSMCTCRHANTSSGSQWKSVTASRSELVPSSGSSVGAKFHCVLKTTHTRTHIHSHWYFYPSPEPLGGCKPYHSQTTEEPQSHQLVLKTPPPPFVCVCVCWGGPRW